MLILAALQVVFSWSCQAWARSSVYQLVYNFQFSMHSGSPERCYDARIKSLNTCANRVHMG
jgi:hypothetical protein